MNIYLEALEQLKRSQQAQNWPLLLSAIERGASRPPVAWDFPLMACRAVGGRDEQAVPAVAAVICAHMAIILIDDLLDEDPRGEQHTIGAGRAANLAAGLSSLGLATLRPAASLLSAEAAADLNEMLGSTALGQDLDVQNVHTEAAYWAVARGKSSPYFSAALGIGALLGGAAPHTAQQLRRFGEIFGEIMQIHDDLNDCLASPANMDWLQGRAPLPILFAELVDHPQRERFLALRSQVAEPAQLAEAQAILVSSGAISYCIEELLGRQTMAEQVLRSTPLVDAEPLQGLLRQTIAPVHKLFASVGADFPQG
jgi:geranylgeranyl diphosphate synthase type I